MPVKFIAFLDNNRKSVACSLFLTVLLRFILTAVKYGIIIRGTIEHFNTERTFLMRNVFTRFMTFFSTVLFSFCALTPVAFAAGNPNTGDNNKVGLVVGLLIASVVVIVLLLVLSAMKKKKGKR